MHRQVGHPLTQVALVLQARQTLIMMSQCHSSPPTQASQED